MINEDERREKEIRELTRLDEARHEQRFLIKQLDAARSLIRNLQRHIHRNYVDTGGPEQGGEFRRGMPGHPDNDMGM